MRGFHGLGILLLTLSVINAKPEANIWFWGCYDGGSNCSLIDEKIWSLIDAPEPIATGVFVGFGHALHSGASWGLGEAGLSITKLVEEAHAINTTVRPIIEYWDKTSDAYKTFVRNETAQAEFISAFTHDAVSHHFDGYNLDWEFGNFNSSDEALMRTFLESFSKALAAHGMQLSMCQGDMRFSNAGPVLEAENYVAYTMGTYSSDIQVFMSQLAYGSRHLSKGNSDLKHFGVGLSASMQSWKAAPTSDELRQRFCSLYLAGVTRVSLYGGDFKWLDEYVPFLRAFVAGPEAFGGRTAMLRACAPHMEGPNGHDVDFGWETILKGYRALKAQIAAAGGLSAA